MKTVAALRVLCLALVAPSVRGGFFWSTVCGDCKCTETDQYVIDCSSLSLTSTYSASDTWPANKSDIRLLFDQNSLEKITPLPALDVVELSYQHNDVTEIADGSFQELRRLRALDLSHNKLDRDSLKEHTFRGQYSVTDYQPSPLRRLNLSYNDIHSIFEDSFSHLSGLTELDLSHNPLAVLDHHTILAVTSLGRLRTLRLAGVGLRTLPAGFLHSLNTLSVLDLADNQLVMVPTDLQSSHAITALRLDNNPIKAIDEDSFNGMTQLETLDLSGMPQLEYIAADAFSSLISLRVLRCRNNKQLWSISPRIFYGFETSRNLFPLKELFLSGNNLTTLDEQTVPFWDQLLLLQLQDNPWQCDCRLQWMATTLLPHLEDVDPQAADQVVCQSPPELAGAPLVRSADTAEALVCPTEPPPFGRYRGGSGSTLAAALTIGALVIFFATGLVGFLFWRRNKIRELYSNKLYVTSMLGASVVLFVCVIFFWFIIAADRAGVVAPSDPLLLRLIGSFFLFLLITAAASLYVIRRQTQASRYRAKQQIRYRRAAMDEEVEMDDPAPTVTI